MMAKPMKTFELYYPIIQFLIILYIHYTKCATDIIMLLE